MPYSEPIPLPQLMRHPLIALHVTCSTLSRMRSGLRVSTVFFISRSVIASAWSVWSVPATCKTPSFSGRSGTSCAPAVTIPADRSADDAARLMRAADVGSVLVTDGSGEPCGIVTRSDFERRATASAILEDCRCESCGSIHHLHRYGERRLCSSCLERAEEPQAFDTGGGD